MFGLKKSLTISGEKNKSGTLEKDTSLSHSGDDSKFIYYAKAEQFISQLEIYVKPNNYPDKKVLLITKIGADFKELNSQIKESFKATSDFKNVAGLTIENLYKVQNESRIILPKTGCISDYLKSGDIIYCDINTDELWIQTYFKITTYNYRKIIKLEYKFQKKMKFKKIKLILLKAGIELFWEELKKKKLDNSFNYFVKGIKFNNKRKKSQTGFELLDFKKKMKYLDNNVEILVNLKFGIFEELIHEQLISMDLNKNEYNYLRLNEYCNLAFEELSNSKKFEPELVTLKDISREFLTSQSNDLNSPFLFYNIKKKETLDEYMYNILNLSNSYQNDIDDEEDDDDQFDFEEDTSFGKFYSDDPSKYFGDITQIKKTKNNYIRRHDNYDSNIIIVAPFLFQLKIIDNKKSLNKNNMNSNIGKVFKTFAHQNDKKTMRQKQDLNNFFIVPLSLDINKDDQNNLLNNNDIDNEENDLVLNTGNIPNIYDKNEEENLENFFGLDDEQSQKEGKRYTVKIDDAMSHQSKRSIFSFMRLSKQSNCCNELYNYFSQVQFIDNLKKKYKNYISKKAMEKIIIPESRNYADVDKSFLLFLKKKENEEDNSLIVKNKKLIIFLCICFAYYLILIFLINTEFINLFI